MVLEPRDEIEDIKSTVGESRRATLPIYEKLKSIFVKWIFLSWCKFAHVKEV